MNKRTINVLCWVGCAFLILQTQSAARAAQDAADASRVRSREATERARRAREKARKAQEELDRANEAQRKSPGPKWFDQP